MHIELATRDPTEYLDELLYYPSQWEKYPYNYLIYWC
jgi:hypothetical protein